MMSQWKYLVFTTAFIAIPTFSAQTMENPLEDDNHSKAVQQQDPDYSGLEYLKTLAKVQYFCKKYKLPGSLMNEIFRKNDKETVFKLNKYGVPNLYWDTAFSFYSKNRESGTFQLLYDLFTMMPSEKREAAFSYLNASLAFYSGKSLAEFYIDPEGEEACFAEHTLKKMISSNIITEDELVKLMFNIVKEKDLSIIWAQDDIAEEAFNRLQKEKDIKIISLQEKLLKLPYQPYQQ